jgi:glycosyltransferase involved in cell wall biosynthesis
VREYVQAARILKARYPDICFHLAGWIDDAPSSIAQHELDAWQKDGSIIFWGRLSDVRAAIRSSSVYVLPSYREGTPRTVLEAMSMGRPIITTDAPGCRQTVVSGRNGILVPVKDVDSLVAAMRHFILHPEDIEVMGKQSAIIAREKYDVHSVNAVMLSKLGLS